MPRIKLVVEYLGTAYVGWQLQPNGVSVQAVLEQALRQLAGEEVRVHSSGRTDAGVHALGMVCHFDSSRQLPMQAWRDGVNRFLPEEVAVREAVEVEQGFHARFSARGKCYRYTILRAKVRSPLYMRTSWQVRQELDVELMRQAAAGFIGEHDFSAFRTTGCAAATTRRRIDSVVLQESGELLYIDVCGSGFLKNMVRMMVGTLVEIGRGKRPVEDISRMLSGQGSGRAALTAPAQGLCLLEVWY